MCILEQFGEKDVAPAAEVAALLEEVVEVGVVVGLLEPLHPGRDRDLGVDQLPDDGGRVDGLDEVALARGERPDTLGSAQKFGDMPYPLFNRYQSTFPFTAIYQNRRNLEMQNS